MIKGSRFLLIIMMGILLGSAYPILAKDESQSLNEDRSVYHQGFGGDITYLYVTVINSMAGDGIPTVPFSMVNSYRYDPEKSCPEADVIIREGNEKQPVDGRFTGTGTIKVRGKTTTEVEQKSFKIKFYNCKWEGQKEINLNKHVFDLTRIRNKLSFDYFKIIPNMTSLRTRFVYLRIKDMTSAHPTGKYVDYGLFTQIEEPDKRFLNAHGLDPKGNLYKAEFFEFWRYPDNLKEKDDPTYDKRKFEQILGICNSKNHLKLLQMLDDVNNPDIPIEEVVAKHFNLDNMLTWLAVNLIMGNTDTNSQNFYLYSPSNSNTWYFLPWDYDGAWGFDKQLGGRKHAISPWKEGLSNYWGMVLFNRMFRRPKYVHALSIKMESIILIINEQKTIEMLKNYHSLVGRFMIKNPDKKSFPAESTLMNLNITGWLNSQKLIIKCIIRVWKIQCLIIWESRLLLENR